MQSAFALLLQLSAALLVVLSFHGPSRTGARAYPYTQRKADPFLTLASTLRQQEQQEQAAMRLEHQQPQNQHPAGPTYSEGPSDDDLYRMEQMRSQLGRAAFMPYFGRTQRNWPPMLNGDDYGNGAGRGGPDDVFMMEEEEGADPALYGTWYDAPEVSSPVDYVQAAADYRDVEEERERQEAQMLLDTLAEYVMMYDAQKAQEQEEAEEELVQQRQMTQMGVEDKRFKIQQSPSPYSDSSKVNATASPVSTTTPALHENIHSSSSNNIRQPPVQRSEDGTPLGQKEFPMPRPAAPQRKIWLPTHLQQMASTAEDSHTEASNSKRHASAKNFASRLPIITSEDQLTEELDNLKLKKN